MRALKVCTFSFLVCRRVCVHALYINRTGLWEPGTIYLHESEFLQPQIKATFWTDIRDPWREETQAGGQGCDTWRLDSRGEEGLVLSKGALPGRGGSAPTARAFRPPLQPTTPRAFRPKFRILQNLRCTCVLLLLLLLLSRFSHVWLCATLETAAHQTPPSMGSARHERWSGCHCPLRHLCARFFKNKSTVWLSLKNN